MKTRGFTLACHGQAGLVNFEQREFLKLIFIILGASPDLPNSMNISFSVSFKNNNVKIGQTFYKVKLIRHFLDA